VLLAGTGRELVAAGLRRVTVSLDALDDATFRACRTPRCRSDAVLDGIAAALAAGLAPVKVNAVLQRGVNDDQIEELAGWARDTVSRCASSSSWTSGRPTGGSDRVVPAAEVVDRIHARWPIEPVAPLRPGEVAERYRYQDGAGEVGVIASVTRPFCGTCSRARLSAIGELYTCLFAAEGHDLRSGCCAAVPTTRPSRGRAWQPSGRRREDRASELRAVDGLEGPRVEMSYIGG
jgi:GTP 3',8-cyclase